MSRRKKGANIQSSSTPVFDNCDCCGGYSCSCGEMISQEIQTDRGRVIFILNPLTGAMEPGIPPRMNDNNR